MTLKAFGIIMQHDDDHHHRLFMILSSKCRACSTCIWSIEEVVITVKERCNASSSTKEDKRTGATTLLTSWVVMATTRTRSYSYCFLAVGRNTHTFILGCRAMMRTATTTTRLSTNSQAWLRCACFADHQCPVDHVLWSPCCSCRIIDQFLPPTIRRQIEKKKGEKERERERKQKKDIWSNRSQKDRTRRAGSMEIGMRCVV